MKKLLIATAVAASMATGAQAAVYNVSSNITGLNLYAFGDVELMSAEAPGYYTGLAFGGTATDADDNGTIDSSDLTLVGEVGFTAAGLNVRLTFDLNSGNYVVGSGVNFTGGTITVDVHTGEDWAPFSVVDASETNLPFFANQPGHWSDEYPAQTTAGLLLAPGLNLLPGLWDGVPGSAGFDNAVSALSLLGATAGMYIDGTVTLSEVSEVPVPGAAWLMGSALVGLAGAARKRKNA